MPSSAAQEEFDALIASSTASHRTSHPEDSHAHYDSASDTASLTSTLESSTLRDTANKPSLRSSARAQPADIDAEDYDDDTDYGPEASTATGKAYHVPRASNTRGEGQTGPKGVIADARAYEREQGSKRRTQAPGLSGVQGKGNVGGASGKIGSDEDADEEDEDEDVDSETEIRKWKAARLVELKAQRTGRRGKPGGGVEYAGLERVDGMGYLEVVEGQAAVQRTVVVFIFAEARWRTRHGDEDESEDEDDDDDDEHMDEASRRFALALAVIASKHSNVRFIALHASEAEMEPAGVPALLAYRAGEMFARIVPLRDEVKLTSNVVDSLEACLQSHDII